MTMDKIISYAWSMGGGALGGSIGFITLADVKSVAIFVISIIIGATLGYFVKRFWDWVFKK